MRFRWLKKKPFFRLTKSDYFFSKVEPQKELTEEVKKAEEIEVRLEMSSSMLSFALSSYGKRLDKPLVKLNHNNYKY